MVAGCDDEVSRIIKAIRKRNNTVESLARALNCSIAELSAKLGLLEIEGLVAIEGERIRLLK